MKIEYTEEQIHQLARLEERIKAAGGETRGPEPWEDEAAMYLNGLLEVAELAEEANQRRKHYARKNITPVIEGFIRTWATCGVGVKLDEIMDHVSEATVELSDNSKLRREVVIESLTRLIRVGKIGIPKDGEGWIYTG